MPPIFLIRILFWGMILWVAKPLELVLTLQRWFDTTRSVLRGYLQTMPQDRLTRYRREEKRGASSA